MVSVAVKIATSTQPTQCSQKMAAKSPSMHLPAPTPLDGQMVRSTPKHLTGRTRKPAMPSNTHIHHPSYGLKSWKPETEPPHQAPASSPSTKLLPHSNHSPSTQPPNSCGLWQQWLDASRWFSFHPSQSTLPQMRRKRGTQSAWQTRKRKWKMHSTPQKRPLDGRQFPHIC